MPLHNYQETCVAFLKKLPAAGLFLDPGMGKTIVTLTALKDLITLGEVNKILVLATKRISTETWPKEIAKWDVDIDYGVAVGTPQYRASQMGHQMTITNYDNLAWIIEQGFDYDTVVVDESSHFKDHRTERFKLMRKVRDGIKRLYILTGSPAPNSLIDLWPQIWLLDQGQRLFPTITKFRYTYCEPEYYTATVVYKFRLRPHADKFISA
jgi:SNF2 family DNA or RNA helicase